MTPASQTVVFVVLINEATPTFPLMDAAKAGFRERATEETLDAKFAGAAII
jgi:hypothetical protein